MCHKAVEGLALHLWPMQCLTKPQTWNKPVQTSVKQANTFERTNSKCSGTYKQLLGYFVKIPQILLTLPDVVREVGDDFIPICHLGGEQDVSFSTQLPPRLLPM